MLRTHRYTACPECEGRGIVRIDSSSANPVEESDWHVCRYCEGLGRVAEGREKSNQEASNRS